MYSLSLILATTSNVSPDCITKYVQTHFKTQKMM